MTTQVAPLRSFVGGEFLSSEGASVPSINPTQPDDVVAQVPIGQPAMVDAAVSAAQEAFAGWAARPGPVRAEMLLKWSAAIQARAEELAQAVVREVGKPIGEARGEVGRCAMILSYFAGEAVRDSGEVIPAQTPGSLQYSIRRPIGVVGLITPWNFPLAIPLWKAAPALALGNTVVLKPSEMSAWIASLLAETAAAAGLPSGVFNVVLGAGPEVGRALVEHAGVSAVSFTGSNKVGMQVAQNCATRNVKFQTEMGGKNPGIVLRDANLAQAAALVAGGAMRFAGQKCTATSRVIVERPVRDAFLKELVAAIEALSVGDPAAASTAVGPVISAESHARLSSALNDADADRLYQGSVSGPGYFVPPTVFETNDLKSNLVQTELFGPVLTLSVAEDRDEAISLANAVPFGLSAALFTRDIASALTYVDRIEAGMVRVNGDTTGVDPHAPFGGVKGSSSHTREQGPSARDFYTETKTVQINP